MKISEANRIIAKYMGWKYNPANKCYVGKLGIDLSINDSTYVSLDALIPVWEKLAEHGVFLNKIGNRKYNHVGFFSNKSPEEYSPFDRFDFYESKGDTIQEAAAIATAKAIQKLKGNE